MSLDLTEIVVRVDKEAEMIIGAVVGATRNLDAAEVRIDSVIVSAIAVVAILESIKAGEEDVAHLLLDLPQVHPPLLPTLTLTAAEETEKEKSRKLKLTRKHFSSLNIVGMSTPISRKRKVKRKTHMPRCSGMAFNGSHAQLKSLILRKMLSVKLLKLSLEMIRPRMRRGLLLQKPLWLKIQHWTWDSLPRIFKSFFQTA